MNYKSGDVITVGNLGKGTIVRQITEARYKRLYLQRYGARPDTLSDVNVAYYLCYVRGEGYIPATSTELS